MVKVIKEKKKRGGGRRGGRSYFMFHTAFIACLNMFCNNKKGHIIRVTQHVESLLHSATHF